MKRFALACIVITVVAGTCPVLLAQEKPVPRYDGKPLEYWIEKLKKAETPGERYAAATAITAFGSDATPALPQLVEMLDDHSEDFRFLIVDVLRSLGAGKSAVHVLLQSLEKKTANNPQAVIWKLKEIGPEAGAAVGVLSTLLEDPKLRCDSARALGAIGLAAKPAVPALGEALKRELSHREPDVFFFIAVTAALGKIGPASVPELKSLLEREDLDDGLKKYPTRALEQIGRPAKDATIPLTRLLKCNDLELRIAAARALWSIEKHKDVLPTMMAILAEETKHVEKESQSPPGTYAWDQKQTEATLEVLRYLTTVCPPVQESLLESRKLLKHPGNSIREAAADLIFAIDPIEGKKIPVGRR